MTLVELVQNCFLFFGGGGGKGGFLHFQKICYHFRKILHVLHIFFHYGFTGLH